MRFLVFILLFTCFYAKAQHTIEGYVRSGGEALGYAEIGIMGSSLGTVADSNGYYRLDGIKEGKYLVRASFLSFEAETVSVSLKGSSSIQSMDFDLRASHSMLDEVVVTGTMREVTRVDSPVPVELYHPAFFKKNPTPNIYEALQNVNGVRPQLNCNVCNTGDIHINGLEGPYTMVLIDGMPIVSSLATVYGLSGIPNSLVERVEIVKGPASSLYGSEAIGGLINIITKDPGKSPVLSLDFMGTDWGEYNIDLGHSFKLGNHSVLTGVNYYNYSSPEDRNADNFTDVTLQERVSIFQKWNIQRNDNKLFSLAGRYYTENRWGGEMQWNESYRGSDEIYGESIVTHRAEFLGQYQLPSVEKLLFSFSANTHHQDAYYGDTPYKARQDILFGQLVWDKSGAKNDLLMGAAMRYTYYDDNTVATGGESDDPSNNPDKIFLPGIFIQNETELNARNKLLTGLRLDYNDAHGFIFTPRLAYKLNLSATDIIRLNAGTGFRVVNLFTEEHAALTGARDVVIRESLEPERSYNANLNYTRKFYFMDGSFINLELSGWYTYFTNLILPDYESNPNQIIYDNLDGSASTKGVSLNAEFNMPTGFSANLGLSLMEVSSLENGERNRQLLTENFTGTWAVSYKFPGSEIKIDYTGNVYSPMLLPLLGELDPRPSESPWWSIQNIQFSYSPGKRLEIYGGVKNLLNWTPWKNQEFPIIARSFDPFDRNVEFDAEGQVIATPENPYALSFDPTYVYAPNQGIRVFAGIRYSIDR